jgi:hypothetical protein
VKEDLITNYYFLEIYQVKQNCKYVARGGHRGVTVAEWSKALYLSTGIPGSNLGRRTNFSTLSGDVNSSYTDFQQLSYPL